MDLGVKYCSRNIDTKANGLEKGENDGQKKKTKY